MSSSFLARLFCCCYIRPRTNRTDVESAVIPNETSRLIDPPSSPAPQITVDHQKLNDKLGTIVRAKEGKMVSVNARAPFTLHSAYNGEDSPSPSGTAGFGSAAVSRLPPVLTMSPSGRLQGSLNLNANHSRGSSASGSRSSSSSRQQSQMRSSSYHSLPPPESVSTNSHGKARQDRERVRENESLSEVSIEDEDESPSRIPIAAAPVSAAVATNTNGAVAPDPHDITFSWSDSPTAVAPGSGTTAANTNDSGAPDPHDIAFSWNDT
ncbi:hypothetical protein C8R43DRAFT_975688 [Mycena crocata]|nr:hypothetical protein C8R43DRAFT_975688 [Mycena crocata]